ncbi:MAG: PAS domain S-box protein [Phycisphaerales bacterium]|nr:MAG: PAS domain S-box protein [Phycisphaerales bacterium]
MPQGGRESDGVARGRGVVARLTPGHITLAYLIVSFTWILGSDWVVESILGESINTARAQTIKGLAFITLVGLLLYVLMSRAERDRRRAETRLRESEERHRRIVEAAQEGIWLLDSRWRTTFVNPRLCEMLGYEASEMLGRALDEFLFEGDKAEAQALMERREQGVAETHDFRLRRKDGTHVWTIVSTSPIVDSRGAFTGVLTMLADISERKRVEDALHALAAASSRSRGRDALRDLSAVLVETLGVRCALVAERSPDHPERVRTLAMLDRGVHLDEVEYDLRGTPCAVVLNGTDVVTPSNVCALYPDDALLREMGVEGYAGAPLFDSDGAVTGIISVLHDRPIEDAEITRSVLRVFASRAASELLRVRAEKERDESEERYRTLVETSPDGVFIQSEGRFAFVNSTMVRMLGAPSSEEVIGRQVLDMFHERDRPAVAERIRRLNEEQIPAEPREEKMLRLDGGEIDVEVTASPYRLNGKPGAQVIVRDVSARKHAERELREREEQYRAVFESAADGLEIFDMEGNLVEANPKACEMHGWSHEEFLALTPDQFIDESSMGQFADCVETVRAGRVFEARAMNKRRDGTPFPIEARGTLMMYAGKPHMLALVRDVTEQVRSERRQSLMMQELDHRVKNNLAAVLSLAEQSIASTESLEAFRNSFVGRVRALATTHAALARTRWEGVLLAEVLHETLGAYNADGLQRVTMHGEDIALPPHAALPVCLTLHELATNAVKYGALSVPEGRVEVRWETRSKAMEKGEMRVEWRELDGPRLDGHKQEGFGSELIRGMIEYELGGTVIFEYPVSGVVCRMAFPLDMAPSEAHDAIRDRSRRDGSRPEGLEAS